MSRGGRFSIFSGFEASPRGPGKTAGKVGGPYIRRAPPCESRPSAESEAVPEHHPALHRAVDPRMDPTTRYILLATVVVAALIIVALMAQRRRGGHQPPWPRPQSECFTLMTPATPLTEDAMKKVLGDIRLICSYGEAFLSANTPAAQKEEGCGAPSGHTERGKPWVAAAREPVKAITVALGTAGDKIHRTAPSWDNYALIYRSLSGSDGLIGKSAGGYIELGRAAHQHIAENPGDPDTMYFTVAGDALIRMGRQIRGLTRSIHELGSALDLE